MQKVLRRTKLAQGQAKRKGRVLQAKITRRDRRMCDRSEDALRREWRDAAREASARHREAWHLGPLAPWNEVRDAVSPLASGAPSGLEAGSYAVKDNAHWGTFSQDQLHLPRKAKADWLREHELVIRPGDRVCVVEGRDRVRGRIGEVEYINCETHAVIVKGVNVIDARAPEAQLDPNARQSSLSRMQEAPVPYSAVRLVYPMSEPLQDNPRELTRPRDAILTELEVRPLKSWEHISEAEELAAIEYEQRVANETFGDDKRGRPRADARRGALFRYLMPDNVRIPWPEPPHVRQFRDEKADTRRTHVEERTFMPTLLRPPMPEGVIDELRNRYGIFRTRHEPEYVAQKQREEAEAERERLLAEEMKDRGARNVARRPRAPEAKPILALLGGHMAYRRAQRLAGASSSSSLPASGPARAPTPVTQ